MLMCNHFVIVSLSRPLAMYLVHLGIMTQVVQTTTGHLRILRVGRIDRHLIQDEITQDLIPHPQIKT